MLEDTELMAIYLPLLKADFALAETYRYVPDEPLSCPIVAFGGRGDREVSVDELEAWQEQTAAAFAIRLVDGGHFLLQTSPAPLLAELAAFVTRNHSPAVI